MDTGRSATRDDDDDGEDRVFAVAGEAWHAHPDPGAHAFRTAATPRQSESVHATADIVGAVRARAERARPSATRGAASMRRVEC
jgi:hypothetical protein